MKSILVLISAVFAIESSAQSCLFGSAYISDMPACPPSGYSLVFEDNFDGTSLDLSKWNVITTVTRDFSFDLRKQWLQTENVQVSEGTLKLVGDKPTTPITGYYWDDDAGINTSNIFEYTSGEIATKAKFHYGLYEIMCRLPNGKGFWPAFWTWSGEPWNEIDIFEIYGDDMDRFTCNVHTDYDSNDTSANCVYDENNLANFTSWHKFTCLYEYDRIVWAVDDNPVRTDFRYRRSGSNPIYCGEEELNGWYMNELSFPINPMHIILNLAIQSGDNAPDGSTNFPGAFEIEYVRFYEHCSDCLTSMGFTNTSLPSCVQAEDFILAGSNTFVLPGQKSTVKAGETVILAPGFSAQEGSDFHASIAHCNDYHRPLLTPPDTAQNESLTLPNINPLLIYPNPANDQLFIESEDIIVQAEIYSINGQLVRKFEVNDTKYRAKLDLETGYYIVKLFTKSGEMKTDKLCIIRQ